MKISAAIREYLIEIEVRKYTPKTIRGYRNSLNLFLRFCEQEAHIQEVLIVYALQRLDEGTNGMKKHQQL